MIFPSGPWAAVWDTLSEAVIGVNQEGRIDYANRAAVRLTKWRLDCALGEEVGHVLRFSDVAGEVVDIQDPGWERGRPRELTLLARDGVNSQVRCRRISPVGDIRLEVWLLEEQAAHPSVARTEAWQADCDVLSGLLNRQAFARQISKHADEPVWWLCEIRIDWFELVQRMTGYAAGEALLRQVALLLRARLHTGEIAARIDHDAFGLLSQHMCRDSAVIAGQALLDELCKFRFFWSDRPFEISFSMGLSSVDIKEAGGRTPLDAAHMACCVAQQRGPGRLWVYDAKAVEVELRQREWYEIESLRRALREERLELYYQPIVALGESAALGDRYELLCRLIDDDGEPVSPARFVPVAERYNLILQLDRLVFKTAMSSLARLYSVSHHRVLARASVNLSAAALENKALLTFILDEFERTGIDPRQVCFEITESMATVDFSLAKAFIGKLRGIGCTFALDDFGSGQSSFAYLMRLRSVDYLKIDGALIQGIGKDPVSVEMVRAITLIARQLGMQTVAEFVDDERLLEELRELGVDYAQGNYLGAARPLSELMSIWPAPSEHFRL